MPDFSQIQARRDLYGPLGASADIAEAQRIGKVVAVKLDDLETSDEWAIYQKHVVALQQAADARIEEIRGALDEAVGDEHARLRLRLREWQGAQRAYVEVLQIPALIRDQMARNLTSP